MSPVDMFSSLRPFSDPVNKQKKCRVNLPFGETRVGGLQLTELKIAFE